MKQRVITAIIALAAVVVVLFALPLLAVQLVIAALLLAGAWEWSGFLDSLSNSTRAVYVVLIAVLLWAFLGPYSAYAGQLLLISMGWWVTALLWTFFYPTPIPGFVRWVAGALVIVPMFVAVFSLYAFDRSMLIFALLVVWVADIGAYFGGRYFGRVKLAPAISPGKTWEGVMGGLIAVSLLTVGRAFVTETDLAVFLPFCLAVAVISIVGDLTVSMFKRTSGMKDSGMLFPGHGGVLDRIDSLAAATPLFAVGTSWIGLR